MLSFGIRHVRRHHDRAGQDAVDPERPRIPAGQFHGQAPRQRGNRPLRGKISGIIQVRPDFGPVAHVDDDAAFRLFDHRQSDMLGAKEGPKSIGIEVQPHVGGRHLFQLLALPDARAIHQDVDPEKLQYLRNHRVHFAFVAESA